MSTEIDQTLIRMKAEIEADYREDRLFAGDDETDFSAGQEPGALDSAGVLDVRYTVEVDSGELKVTRVEVVLGTGGPHFELHATDRGLVEVTGWDWFGKDASTREVVINGAPIVEHFAEYIDGMTVSG